MLRSKSRTIHRLSSLRSTKSSAQPSAYRNRFTLAAVLVSTGAFYVALPAPAAQAQFWWINRNEYERCASDLAELELTDATIAEACAAALRPDELSNCVSRISRDTTVAPATALAGCQRDRRPEDLAECVVDIDRSTEGEYGDAALDYCRRSLLPLAFSDCVVGLRSELDTLAPLPALDTCIAADDRPVEYLPDFVYPGPPIEIPTTVTPNQPVQIVPSTPVTPLSPAPQTAPVPALF